MADRQVADRLSCEVLALRHLVEEHPELGGEVLSLLEAVAWGLLDLSPPRGSIAAQTLPALAAFEREAEARMDLSGARRHAREVIARHPCIHTPDLLAQEYLAVGEGSAP